MKGQPKHWSLIESLTNVAVGFFVAMAATALLLPMMGFEVSLHQNLVLTTIFTGISIIRSYVLRRVFNWVHILRERG